MLDSKLLLRDLTLMRQEKHLVTPAPRIASHFLNYSIIYIIYEGDVSANSAPPKNVENIEIVKTASRPIRHPRGCIGASNGASTALKLPGKPEIHVFFVRLYTYSGP